MDVCESEQGSGKHKSVQTPRAAPFVLAEKNNAPTTRRSRTKQVSSRYKSPVPANPTEFTSLHKSPTPVATREVSSRYRSPSPAPLSRRFPSPNPTRTALPSSSSSSSSLQKRAQSSERRRPSTPPSPPPPRPSTPVRDSSLDVKLSSGRAAAGGRLPESLWPSTMRSLSVSFNSDSISSPVSKKSKPVTSLRPTSNVAHKQAETLPLIRKPTPERKRSPLKGKDISNQSENSKPVEILPSKFIDQHRWPSRIGGKVSSSPLNRSVDLAVSRSFDTPAPTTVLSSLKRYSSDAITLFSRVGSGNVSGEVLRSQKSLPLTPSGKAGPGFTGVRSQSLSVPGSHSHPALPSRTSALSCSGTRGISPSRSRPSTPPPRGVSPSRIRSSGSSVQSSNSNSVLSFIADFRKGNKGAANVEDAHQLRLLYNRYLQWRFTNARAEAALYIQNAIVERTLYDVWRTTLSLLESVIRNRIDLQQRKLELKLNSILNDEMTFLDDWAVFERDHGDTLSGAVQDFKASTLCLPVAGGAKVDIEHLKAAIGQAVDVMQAMGSTICSSLLRVEGMNNLISEVAIVAAKEKALLDECELLLASVAAIQVEESSVRTHLMQIKPALGMSK
ncbi:hypothetical protein HN51_012385 [Arachis hypogaea]|uniref:AUGMIN subunit 8 n=1 Tax=Arachis hypogaea TaxID=3818 RepID=A0A445DUS0_ARAHY|nr:AUGMIN subunit [Arachis hypogaea]QHO57865.1 AUGMIN subunit [Arachis hypogaea]RYR66916.1 hypothetical protein Ahy_A03g013109 isoform A [Arachis hypogaea]RYR66917.1 hypothetical protein Ahy_A03g013109 isoform B [Arachis hypogaea]